MINSLHPKDFYEVFNGVFCKGWREMLPNPIGYVSEIEYESIIYLMHFLDEVPDNIVFIKIDDEVEEIFAERGYVLANYYTPQTGYRDFYVKRDFVDNIPGLQGYINLIYDFRTYEESEYEKQLLFNTFLSDGDEI